MEADILKTLQYFLQFSYPPTLEELFLFHPQKTSRLRIRRGLEVLVKQKKVIEKEINLVMRYTIGGYSIPFKKYPVRTVYSENKKKKILVYKNLISVFRNILFVGISGSVSMNNAKSVDDVDLFIITGRNRLWTGRLIAVLTAEVLGIHRRWKTAYSVDMVCLNLFFDGSDLKVPKIKQNEYVAHEILQLKPLINKEHIYESFIWQNRWIFDIFPNSIDLFRSSRKRTYRAGGLKFKIFSWVGDIFEWFCEKAQKYHIRKHQTTELLTQTQLWFHPDDYENKLKKK